MSDDEVIGEILYDALRDAKIQLEKQEGYLAADKEQYETAIAKQEARIKPLREKVEALRKYFDE